jgi:hypothetical protein
VPGTEWTARRAGGTGGASLASCIAAGVIAAVVLAACSDDDDAGSEPDATLSSPQTPPPPLLHVTLPAQTAAGEDGSFLDDVLADDTVTANELDDAYQRYVDCLVDGGGTGRYAYDIELRTGIVVDWTIDPDDDDPVDRERLSTSCSRQFLGDLIRRHHRANPPATDLVELQRASIVDCLETVSPAAAATLPDDISVDTAGQGSIGE